MCVKHHGHGLFSITVSVCQMSCEGLAINTLLSVCNCQCNVYVSQSILNSFNAKSVNIFRSQNRLLSCVCQYCRLTNFILFLFFYATTVPPPLGIVSTFYSFPMITLYTIINNIATDLNCTFYSNTVCSAF